MKLDCAHVLDSGSTGRQVCPHLPGAADLDYWQVFTGKGRTYRLACPACAAEPDRDAVSWRSVCAACVTEIEAENGWDGISGTPEIAVELSSLSFTHRTVEMPGDGSTVLRLVEPIPEASGSLWVGLTASGQLVRIDLDTGTLQTIAEISVHDLDIGEEISLVCSPRGEFICLTETLGGRGVVIASDTGDKTLRLQREEYCSHVSPFSAAFVVYKGRTLLIHATAWNRLEVSDPVTGELMRNRASTEYSEGEKAPEHYLDYFHGQLTVSPDGDYVADNGWVWHPHGVVRTWSVRRWLEENIWESEDGPTVKDLVWRAYFWQGSLCWINDRTLAIWGYGDDDEWMLPAVRLFDVVSGMEIDWFPGPQGRLVFDRYLFAFGASGVSVWDIEKGTRLLQDGSFSPVAYQPATKEFLTIRPDGSLQLSRLSDPAAE